MAHIIAKQVFDMIDRDHNGLLTRAEIIVGVRKNPELRHLLGLPDHIRQEDGSRDLFEQVFQHIDLDDSKAVSLAEFQSYVVEIISAGQPVNHPQRWQQRGSRRYKASPSRVLA